LGIFTEEWQHSCAAKNVIAEFGLAQADGNPMKKTVITKELMKYWCWLNLQK
jgi:hypothetical protein